MKKRIVVILALCLSITALMCGSLSVSASSYVVNVIAEDLSSESDCNFLAPGDMDADGEVGADDLVILRQLLLTHIRDNAYTAVYKANGEKAKYSDINGDEFVDIKDLVRIKKNSVKNFLFVNNGVMSLNGNSAFKGEFTSVLDEDTVYEVCLTYKSDSPIKIKIADLDEEVVFDSVSKVSTVAKTIETPSTITDAKGIDFQIIGVASIESISVTRGNIDNDLVDNW